MKLKSKKTVACFFYILFYTLSMDPMDKMEIEEEKETIETETIFKQKAPAVLMYYEEEKTPFAFLTFFNKEATNTLVRLTENLNPEDLDFIDSDNSFKENLFNLEIDLHSFSKMKLIGDTYIKCYNENLNKNALVNFEKKTFHTIKEEFGISWDIDISTMSNFEKLIKKIQEEQEDYEFIMYLNGAMQEINKLNSVGFKKLPRGNDESNKDFSLVFAKNDADETVIPCILFKNKQSFKNTFNSYFVSKELFPKNTSINKDKIKSLAKDFYKGDIMEKILRNKITYKDIMNSRTITL